MSWPPGSAGGSGPLEGVRVLDLSRILAGPFSTTILSDLGADVIKVERAGTGDETRRWGPPFAPNGTAAYFYACNRGKRSITLDLREPSDQAIALGLIEEADLLLENFLPGAMDRMGLDRATLQERNPRLVHCVISGYGHQSSRGSWPGLDFVVQAHAGVLGVTGSDPEHPVKAGVPVADLSAGLYATIGMLAALRRAAETGEGAHIEVALADACASLLTNQAMNVLIGGLEPEPKGNTHPSIAPYQTLHAADRLIAIAAASEVQFERMCRVIGREDLLADERFARNADRVAHRAELERLLEEAFTQRAAADWVRELNEAGVAAAVVNTPGEMLSDPDTRERLVTELRDGDAVVPQLRTPIRIDGRPLEPGAPPPALGAHDAAIRDAIETNGRVT
jgi:crotonobetainyl-CoA:carnitine CoA-transferase CaiB-like acyl-CoA transferase